jgi:hypothetical protein
VLILGSKYSKIVLFLEPMTYGALFFRFIKCIIPTGSSLHYEVTEFAVVVEVERVLSFTSKNNMVH